jgi:hypothetical protein
MTTSSSQCRAFSICQCVRAMRKKPGGLWHERERVDANLSFDLAVNLARRFDTAEGRKSGKLMMLGKTRRFHD